MSEELTYVLITPYSLLKSRTGGIIGRLLSLSNLEFVGARMYAPSDEFVDRYCNTIREQDSPPRIRRILLSYIDDYFRPQNRFQISNRTMALLFRGPNALSTLHADVIGPISDHLKGDTVRGTYGDFVARPDGEVEYFEPAVLTAADPVTNRRQLELLAEYAVSDGGVLTNVLRFPEGVVPETTLVILKPDNFQRRSSRPGNIIDMFSRTGLFIVGAGLLRMSVAQAEEFYAPVREMFVERLKNQVESLLEGAIEQTFEFDVPPDTMARMADMLKELNAECEFNKIVSYMTGLSPSDVKDEAIRKGPGLEKCLALLYQGENAITKIRERLGATDPQKAADGTVRSVYGQDLMKNGAHASDSVENAERERKIIGLWDNSGPCEFRDIIEEHLRGA